MLIFLACSKNSDDDNPKPDKPTPEQPQTQPKEGFISLDKNEKKVLSARYEDNGNGNYTLYLYLSEDLKEKVRIDYNESLHLGKTIDLTKTEEEHKEKENWSIIYWQTQKGDFFFASGKNKSNLFSNGTLSLSGSLAGTFNVVLANGKIKNNGVERTFAINYKGKFSKTGETPNPDPTDTEPPKVTGNIEVDEIKNTSAIIRWPPATDNKTPDNKLTYFLFWQEKGSDKINVNREAMPEGNLIDNLTEGATYIVWVAVRDEAGNEALYPKKQFTLLNDPYDPGTGPEVAEIIVNGKTKTVYGVSYDHSGGADQNNYYFTFKLSENGTERLEISIHQEDFGKTLKLTERQKERPYGSYYEIGRASCRERV